MLGAPTPVVVTTRTHSVRLVHKSRDKSGASPILPQATFFF